MSGETHPSQRQLHISASQSRITPLLKLQGIFGGKINQTRQTHTGNTIYMWRLGGSADAIKEFVPLVLPYLTVKKREAEIVLAFAQTVRRRGRPKRGVINFTSREEVAQRMELIGELDVIRGRAA